MSLVDIELEVGPEERMILDNVHRFAVEVMRPVGEQLDKLADPADVIADDSPLWGVFERYRELGLDALSAADSSLTEVAQARLNAMVSEELGWGDSGLAISLGVSGFPRFFAQMSGHPELLERYGAEDSQEIGCWAITEPDHGSDVLDTGDHSGRQLTPRPNCIARRDGDDFLIQGQKSAWVSNGTIATSAVLFCALDGEANGAGVVAIVPLDLAGVSRGVPLDKLGQRALNQGEIFFDAVRIPAHYAVVVGDAYPLVLDQILTVANASMGATFVGVARAALEHALAYAKERVQGGVPIFEHQSVQARLFKMFSQVEASRALSRRVAIYNNSQPTPLLHYSIASKTTSTNTAFEVASAAVQIFGGNGMSRSYPVEKLLRDARASMIEDGCNEFLGLIGATRL